MQLNNSRQDNKTLRHGSAESSCLLLYPSQDGQNSFADLHKNVDFMRFLSKPRQTTQKKKTGKSLSFGAYKQLLIALKKAGIITQGVDDNNIFGSGTTAATKQLQKAAKLTQDGLAGSQTIRAAYKALFLQRLIQTKMLIAGEKAQN